MEKLFKRIGKEISMIDLSKTICSSYCIGEYKEYELIFVGIDDLSYFLYTTKGKYVVKIMNHEKTEQEIEEFIQKSLIITKNCQRTPNILLHNQKPLFVYQIEGIQIKLIVMECIEGKDLYSLNQKITKEDIQQLIEILVPFHQIKTKIQVKEYDDYCFVKIQEGYEKTKKVLPQTIKIKVEEEIKEFGKIRLEKLPKCFIHGDLIASNIIKDQNEKLWFIDFFQSGKGMRILDIVKILNSVIDNYQYKENTEELENYFLEEYNKRMTLTQYELEVLPILRKIDVCTGIMLETYDMIQNENDTENEYWLKNDKYIYKKLKNS